MCNSNTYINIKVESCFKKTLASRGILKSTKSILLKKRVTFDELMSTVSAHTTEKTSEEKEIMKNAFNQNAVHIPSVSSSATLLKNTDCTIVQNNHVHCTPISTSQIMEKNQTVSSALQHHQITQHKSCEDNTKTSTSQANNVIVISDEEESQFDDVIFIMCCVMCYVLYKFFPLSKNSREEIGPLVEISHIESNCMAEYKNIGWNCIRASR